MAELMSVKAIEREKSLLYVLQDRLGLAGFKGVSKDDLGATVTVIVESACRALGRQKSSGMAELKRPIAWTNVYAYRGTPRPLSFSSESQEYHFSRVSKPALCRRCLVNQRRASGTEARSAGKQCRSKVE